MGAGHWTFRHTEFATSNYHIDDIDSNFEEEREAALNQIKEHIGKHPELLAPFKEEADLEHLDLDWCFEHLQEVTDELALAHLNCSIESFSMDASAQTVDRLQESLTTAFSGDSIITGCWKDAETLGQGRNSHFTVAGEGRYVEVGFRHWENNLYIGVHPKYQLENYEDSINGKSFDPSTGKVEGSDLKMFLKIQQVLAAAALVVEPSNADYKALALATAEQADLDDIFGPDTPSYRQTVSSIPEALLERAEQAAGTEDAAHFELHFGISAEDFLDYRPIVELIAAVYDDVGDYPETINRGYQAEFDHVDALVLQAVHEVSPEVYTPTSAWTSGKVEYKKQEPDLPGQRATQPAPAVPSGPSM